MVTLEPTSESDLDFIVACEASYDTARFIVPWTRQRHLTAIANPDCGHLLIRDQGTGERIGFVLLFGLTSEHRTIEFRRIVVHARRGTGVGRAAVQQVKRLAFGPLNAHRLWLDVKSKNARARHLYASEGFIEEGVMRECLLEDDGFESLVLMSILRSEVERA